ncbi:hypothetical protein K493DRAFT_42886 [Basidiobolus meristosporus CBS 931.73]|uniref:PAS domain-containing protein n=1 Tax=Basidiobolus meristosporus CBS 931.73 TaxID=1314790 RepID=A0A1Y1Y3C0_9FUNG|nr:hypothetical protein K493DRAFT_42886 [Basidiobolus meristosporus CBS 931.73]|eukprot:ORX92521.1 hypothetical protein K493DRAFT_42886 [Basidiobolus meristosporus CBS 931.73]
MNSLGPFVHQDDADSNPEKDSLNADSKPVLLEVQSKTPMPLEDVEETPNTKSLVAIPSESAQVQKWSQRIMLELTDVYYVTTISGRLIFCSKSCQELTGYPPEELIGRSLSDFIHVDDNDSFLRDLNHGVAKKSFTVLYRFRKKNNRFVMLEVQCRTYLANDNAAYYFCNARQYPSKANSMLDTFLDMKIENELLRKRLRKLSRNTNDAKKLPCSNIDPSLRVASRLSSLVGEKSSLGARSSIDLRGGSLEHPGQESESESDRDDEMAQNGAKKKKHTTSDEDERTCANDSDQKPPKLMESNQSDLL